MLDKKELVIGNYYYYAWGNSTCVTKHGKNEDPFISATMKTLKMSGSFGFDPYNKKELREATSEEIYWLDHCMKIKKYVPMKKVVKPSYQIY